MHDFLLDRVGHQLSFVVDVELPHQVEPVSFDGFDAQVQFPRDLRRAFPGADELEDLQFTVAQRLRRRFVRLGQLQRPGIFDR